MNEVDSTFTLYGRAPANSAIEIYLAHPADGSPPADISGYGEACTYIGSITADGSGNFDYIIPNTIIYYSQVTMTATDENGNTSEFCENAVLTPSPLRIIGTSYEDSTYNVVLGDTLINLWVTNPEGDYIGKDWDGNFENTITGATYDENGRDIITIPYPIEGIYTINVYGQLLDPPYGSVYGIGIEIDGSNLSVQVANYMPIPGNDGITTDTFTYSVAEGQHHCKGDVNCSYTVNILDITYLISYLYKGGPEPCPILDAGDANYSCDIEDPITVNILDITYLISYLYKDGPAPCTICLEAGR
jgi:hypothetical protein